jgi:hypothetical protein
MILFVFRRRGARDPDAMNHFNIQWPFHTSKSAPRRAAEKQKEIDRVAFLSINRPPLRGLAAETSADPNRPLTLRVESLIVSALWSTFCHIPCWDFLGIWILGFGISVP